MEETIEQPQEAIEKKCEECGIILERRANENALRFRDRKYCSNECYHTNYRKLKKGWHRSFFPKKSEE